MLGGEERPGRITRTALDDALVGGGAMGTRMRAEDWCATPLGDASRWPQSLRSALSICLGSAFPIALYWGPSLALLYNDAWSPILGGKHPWGLGRPAREVWPEIWDTIGPMFARVMESGEATYAENSLLPMHRHGYTEECYFDFTFSPIRGEGGGVDGVFNAVVETTYRVVDDRRTRVLRELAQHVAPARSADEAFVLSAEALATAVHDVPFCAIYALRDGSATAHLVAAHGVARGTSAAPATVLLGAEDADGWPFARPLRSHEVEVVGGLGSRLGPLPGAVWPEPATSALIAPLVSSSAGGVIGFAVLGVSPRRAVDAAYLRFAERVASQIASAASAGSAYEAERLRAEGLAELDRAKTEFFSNVSHELRTPLTLILGPLADALASPAGALHGTDLETAHRNALRLQRLVNGLLDFSRIEGGRVRPALEATDLASLTRDLAGVFRSAIERAGLRFVVDAPPLGARALVDHDMWEKIVLNLLSNALKFTMEGEITLTLRADGGEAVLAVRDTGIGVSPSELPHLFERFYRARGAAGHAGARTMEGSGIGLALVAELVKLHHGRASVESALGQGSTFEVRIPLDTAHPVDAAVPGRATPRATDAAMSYVEEARRWTPDGSSAAPATGRAAPPGEPTPESPARPRIVLADDNADMRDYIERLLGPRHRVEVAADGVAALEAIRREPPDLVLSDVMMPRLDGFGLLQALRSDPKTRAVPVILLSARAGEESTADGLGAGANDYVVKPFAAQELLARVGSQLAIAAVRREADREREAQRNVVETLFGAAPAGIALVRGPDLVIEFCNARALEIWQRASPDGVIGRPVLEALPELRGQGFDDLLHQVMRTGEPFTGNAVPATFLRDGTEVTRVLDFTYVPTRDARGAIDGVAVFAFDVTAVTRARARAELGARVGRAFVAETTLAAQLTECCEGLCGMGLAAARIWTHDATHDTLELRASSGIDAVADGSDARIAVGSTVIGRVARDREPLVVDDVQNGLDAFDRTWATRGGMTALAVHPLRAGDRLLGVLAVSARGPLAADVPAILASVADGIAVGIERDESARFRELFIGMLGHDLRNPLNAVRLAAHILEAAVPDAQRRVVARIHSSTTRMERMIAQVLDFTRARSGGGIPLVRQPVDLGALCAQLVDELVGAAPDRAFEVTTSGDPRGMWDPDRLAQLLSNLLGNALAYGRPDAPIRVTIDGGPRAVTVLVHNQGPPIPPQELPTLFDAFRRAAHPKARGTQGLGLGLFISHQIVLAHGGTIAVTSTEREGTLFTVVLPRTEDHH